MLIIYTVKLSMLAIKLTANEAMWMKKPYTSFYALLEI